MMELQANTLDSQVQVSERSEQINKPSAAINTNEVNIEFAGFKRMGTYNNNLKKTMTLRNSIKLGGSQKLEGVGDDAFGGKALQEEEKKEESPAQLK